MANATKIFPLDCMIMTQLSRPATPSPRFAIGVNKTATTFSFVDALKDSAGDVITKALFLGLQDENGYVETSLVPTGSLAYDAQTANFTVGSVLTGGTSGAKAIIVRDTDGGTTGTLTLVVYSGTFQDNETITDEAGGSAAVNGTLIGAISADGKTATGVVRGINLDGLDWITGNSDLAVPHKATDVIFCNIAGVYGALVLAVLNGAIATGGNGLIVGTEPGAAGETITFYRTTTAGVKKGVFRWTPTAAQYSDDGETWVNNRDVSSSDLFKVSANDTTPGYLNGKGVAGDGIEFTENNDGGDETLTFAVKASDLVSGDYGLEVASNDVRVKLASTPGLEFSTGLKVKTKTGGGVNIDVDGLYVEDAIYEQDTYYALEAVTADQALCLKENQVQWYTQLTDANLALGNANSTRAYAIKVTAARSGTMTDFRFRAAEAVNASTALGNLVITLEADNSGEPSGTPLATETITQTTQRTWNTTMATRTATWDTPYTLVAGTTYWIVFTVSATDATNYLNLGVNSTYDENYVTYTRLTYNLDTATWGSSVTNATPFFWGNTETSPFGYGVVPTDANWGGRTWSFKGFAKANASAGAEVVVYVDRVPDLTGIMAGQKYYLSSTPGGITTTKPGSLYSGSVFAYQVGYGINDTELQIETGERYVFGTLAPIGSATTTHKLITWFKPDLMEVGGAYDSNGTTSHLTIKGIYDGTSNYSTGFLSDDGGNDTGFTETGRSYGYSSGAYWAGVGSNVTDVGLTYTVTKTSTPDDYTILYEITG